MRRHSQLGLPTWTYIVDYQNFHLLDKQLPVALLTDTLIKLCKYEENLTRAFVMELGEKIRSATNQQIINEAWFMTGEKFKSLLSGSKYKKQLADRMFLCYFVAAAFNHAPSFVSLADVHCSFEQKYLHTLINHLSKKIELLPLLQPYYETFNPFSIVLLYKTAFDLQHAIEIAKKMNEYLSTQLHNLNEQSPLVILTQLIQDLTVTASLLSIPIINQSFEILLNYASILIKDRAPAKHIRIQDYLITVLNNYKYMLKRFKKTSTSLYNEAKENMFLIISKLAKQLQMSGFYREAFSAIDFAVENCVAHLEDNLKYKLTELALNVAQNAIDHQTSDVVRREFQTKRDAYEELQKNIETFNAETPFAEKKILPRVSFHAIPAEIESLPKPHIEVAATNESLVTPQPDKEEATTMCLTEFPTEPVVDSKWRKSCNIYALFGKSDWEKKILERRQLLEDSDEEDNRISLSF